LMKTA